MRKKEDTQMLNQNKVRLSLNVVETLEVEIMRMK